MSLKGGTLLGIVLGVVLYELYHRRIVGGAG